MKTPADCSLHIDPELRSAAEAVLEEGETLSSFVAQSLRRYIARRVNQRAFIARGLASRDEAKRTGEYYDADDVLAELVAISARADARFRRTLR